MCNDRLIIILLEETLKSDLDLSLHGHMTAEFFRISSLKQDVICVIVFVRKRFYIALGHRLHCLCNFIHRISVYFPAEFDLCLYFIAVCNRNVSHVVSHSHNAHMAALDHSHCRTHP